VTTTKLCIECGKELPPHESPEGQRMPDGGTVPACPGECEKTEGLFGAASRLRRPEQYQA
jgi:hypothetical protein